MADKIPGNSKKLEWILRLAVFGTFLGHGIFALGGLLFNKPKTGWYPYFEAIGIANPDTIGLLLTLIGLMDVVVAFVVLFKPIRGVLLWAVVWAFVTALIRPVAGDFFGMDFWDLVERASNFMAPLALLLFYGWPRNIGEWFSVKN